MNTWNKIWDVVPVWAALIAIMFVISIAGKTISAAIDRQTEALMSDACEVE